MSADAYIQARISEARFKLHSYPHAALSELNLARAYAKREGVSVPTEVYSLTYLACRSIVHDKLKLAHEDAEQNDWLSAASDWDAVEIYAHIGDVGLSDTDRELGYRIRKEEEKITGVYFVPQLQL